MNLKKLFFGPTVVEVAWEWQTNIPRSEKTNYDLSNSIKTYIVPFWQGKRIKKVHKKDVSEFLSSLRNLKNKKSGAPLSPYTQWSIAKNVRAIFNYAVRMNIIKETPMKGIYIGQPKSVVKYYEISHAKILLNAYYPNIYYKLAVLLALCAGLRRGEVAALRWEDVDFDKKLLYIRRSVNIVRGTRYEKLPKSGKERIGIINEPLYKALITAKLSAVQEHVILLSPWQITKWFPRFAEQQGIPRLSYHSLRKTFGTLLLQSGADIKTVSVLLGHSSISVTSKSYIGTSQARMEMAVNTLYQ